MEEPLTVDLNFADGSWSESLSKYIVEQISRFIRNFPAPPKSVLVSVWEDRLIMKAECMGRPHIECLYLPEEEVGWMRPERQEP
jgi:hypothetical protein